MELYVVRHGQTAYNAENRACGGMTDIPLAPKGREQARLLGETLRDISFDKVIVSPMVRAQETAALALDGRGFEFETDERIIEHRFGSFEGCQIDDEEFWRLRWNPAYRFPEGGESLFQVVARVYCLLDELPQRFPHQTVLLVCHGAISRVIYSYYESLTDQELKEFFMPNCGLLHFSV